MRGRIGSWNDRYFTSIGVGTVSSSTKSTSFLDWERQKRSSSIIGAEFGQFAENRILYQGSHIRPVTYRLELPEHHVAQARIQEEDLAHTRDLFPSIADGSQTPPCVRQENPGTSCGCRAWTQNVKRATNLMGAALLVVRLSYRQELDPSSSGGSNRSAS